MQAITNSHDRDEARKIERRRQFEDDRKKRIFNARQRLFGLDMDALDRQRQEKDKIQSKLAECERHWEEEEKRQQNIFEAEFRNQEKHRRAQLVDLNGFRCRFQAADQRREFDLNDPKALKKQLPMRISDHDPSLGISSAQVFVGEDVGNAERRRRQRAQQRAWLDQQIAERRNAENARLKADNMLTNNLMDNESRLHFMAQADKRIRNETVDSIRRYNVEVAEQKRMERERERKERWEDDMAEISNMLSSDMLSENPDVAQSQTDPNKKVAYLYRGLTPAEVRVFYKEQQEQIADVKRRRNEREIVDEMWGQLAVNRDRELQLKEIEMEAKRNAETAEFFEYNCKLAEMQRKQREMDEIAKRNQISKDFYDQFNKTSR